MFLQGIQPELFLSSVCLKSLQSDQFVRGDKQCETPAPLHSNTRAGRKPQDQATAYRGFSLQSFFHCTLPLLKLLPPLLLFKLQSSAQPLMIHHPPAAQPGGVDMAGTVNLYTS